MSFTTWVKLNESQMTRQAFASLEAIDELIPQIQALLNSLLPQSQAQHPPAQFDPQGTGRSQFRGQMKSMGMWGHHREWMSISREALLNEIGSQVPYANTLADEHRTKQIQRGLELLKQLKNHVDIVSGHMDAGGSVTATGGGGAKTAKMTAGAIKDVAGQTAALMRMPNLTDKQRAKLFDHIGLLQQAKELSLEPWSYGEIKVYSSFPNKAAKAAYGNNNEIAFGGKGRSGDDPMSRFMENPFGEMRYFRGKATDEVMGDEKKMALRQHPKVIKFHIGVRDEITRATGLAQHWTSAPHPIVDKERKAANDPNRPHRGYIVSHKAGVIKAQFGGHGSPDIVIYVLPKDKDKIYSPKNDPQLDGIWNTITNAAGNVTGGHGGAVSQAAPDQTLHGNR